jgi:N-acetylglucosaminyldiphosphoundecaprenol N-acetyl-beta-D-mannosaminyltransferase
MGKVSIINTQIDNLSFCKTVDTIVQWLQKKECPRYVVTPNVDHIIRLQQDKEFQEIYEKADLVVPDGMPLVWAARFLGTPLYEKVSGSDLFEKLCEIAAREQFKLFFLGGNPGDAEQARENLLQKNPGLSVVGIDCPEFGFEHSSDEKRRIAEKIINAGPDILFVGLGSPKQEKWIYHYYRQIGVPVSIGIGVSFSFAAGTIKRAPVWMQKAGLEWFWRLVKEPGRLWKRYLVDDMKFFVLLLKQKLLKKKQDRKPVLRI